MNEHEIIVIYFINIFLSRVRLIPYLRSHCVGLRSSEMNIKYDNRDGYTEIKCKEKVINSERGIISIVLCSSSSSSCVEEHL